MADLEVLAQELSGPAEGDHLKFEQHCRRCQDLIGNPFARVHLWIDQLAWLEGAGWEGERFDPGHRRHRHHMAGIDQVRQMWGDKSAQAAALHVLDDLYGPVPHSAKHEIPLDEQDYVRKGWH